MPELSIRLLGGFGLADDGKQVELPGRRQQELLAAIALAGTERQTRNSLAALLWPDAGEAQSRSNLRKLVHDLRSAWPGLDRYLHFGRDVVSWREETGHEVDAALFCAGAIAASDPPAIEAAASLYGGPLLPECYEDWVLPHRERAHELYLGLLQKGMALCEQHRAYEQARSFGDQLLALEPLREDVHLGLIRIHALQGDRSGALRRYHVCSSVLEQELGVEPGHEIQALHARLMGSNQAEEAPRFHGEREQLVGRKQEWRHLQEAWRATLSGAPKAIALRGDPGIGKTRLGQEMAEWAERQGIQVWRTQGYEGEEAVPFAASIRLLAAMPIPPLAAHLAQELDHLLPAGRAASETRPLGREDDAWHRGLLLEALGRVILARQPAILLVDDLQWCDAETLQAIEGISRLDPRARILLLALTRERTVSGGHHRLLTGYAARNALVDLELAPLDRGETAELAASVGQPPAGGPAVAPPDAEGVYQATEGNPLFIVELMRWEGNNPPADGEPGDAPIPASVAAAIRRRFGELSEGAHALMGTAAAIGRDFELTVLARAASQTEEDLVRNVDALWRMRIVREQGRFGYDFTHAYVRDVAYSELSNAAKRLAHRRVAEAFAAIAPGGSHVHAAEAARHFELAGAATEAAAWYARAGEAARLVYANEAAIVYLERATEPGSGDDPEAHLGLAAILQTTGSWEAAGRSYESALKLSTRHGRPLTTARAAMGIGDIARLQSKFDHALRWFDRAARALRSLDEPSIRAQLAALRCDVYLWQAEYERARVEATTQLELARREHDEAQEASALGNLGTVAMRLSHTDEALRLYLSSLELEQRLGNNAGLLRVLGQIGNAHRLRGDLKSAEETLERQVALAREVGNPHMEAVGLSSLSVTLEVQGHLDRARPLVEQALRMHRELGDRMRQASALHNLAVILHDLGDTAKALEMIAEAFTIETEIGDRRNASVALANTGVLYGEMGEFVHAEKCLLSAFATSQAMGNRQNALYCAIALSELLLQQGRLEEGRRLAEQSAVMARRLENPAWVCQAVECLAEVCMEQGDVDDALACAREALAIATELGTASIRFKAGLLAARIGVSRGELEAMEGVNEGRRLLRTVRSERERADGAFALWEMDPSDEKLRERGTRLARRVYMKSGSVIQARRLRSLGSPLPARPAPRLPLPPDISNGISLSLEDMGQVLIKMVSEGFVGQGSHPVTAESPAAPLTA